MTHRSWGFICRMAALVLWAGAAMANPEEWRQGEWPRTDFSRHSIDYSEIKSGGPPKDGIPAIDNPRFEDLKEGQEEGWAAGLADTEPVISFSVGSDARAYPLRVLMWHEIVNDTVGGEPVAVTYCPLCNAALVFERTVNGRVLDFGATGKLRHSDLVMYDRQTESWWQQFTGEAIVGEMTGSELKLIPSRLESFARFRERFSQGRVLVPNDPAARDYGANPYLGYGGRGDAFPLHGQHAIRHRAYGARRRDRDRSGPARSLVARPLARTGRNQNRRPGLALGGRAKLRSRCAYGCFWTRRGQRHRPTQRRGSSRRRAS